MASAEAAGVLGVFGGTFDPLHIGHLIVAQEAFEALSLDAMLLVPALRSPLKPSEVHASPELRCQMVRSATDGDSRFELCELELRRAGPSYTVETLKAIQAERPAAQLVLVLGADQWAQFGRWREPAEIARIASIALLTRAGERPSTLDPGFEPDSAPSFREVSVSRMDVSSSAVRERIGAGLSVRYLVPEPVRRIIEANDLYRRPSEF